MIWNDHSRDVPEGAHAFLGASKHSWTEKTTEEVVEQFKNHYAQSAGTALHNLASFMIKHKIRISKTDRKLIILELLKNNIPRFAIEVDIFLNALLPFVNDSIGYGMRSEQVLYYSKWAFGTADAINFQDNKLLIFDLKTGISRVSVRQLEVYAALYCLEYNADPRKIDIELRFYQRGEVTVYEPDGNDIFGLMAKIRTLSSQLDELVGD